MTTKKFISTELAKQVQQTRQLPDQSFLIKMNTKIFSLLLQMHLINDDITYYLCITIALLSSIIIFELATHFDFKSQHAWPLIQPFTARIFLVGI